MNSILVEFENLDITQEVSENLDITQDCQLNAQFGQQLVEKEDQ